MSKNQVIIVNNIKITISSVNDEDYISLTDMVRGFEGGDQLLYNWMRNRNTLEFLGTWEMINNPNFKGVEFETFKTQAGLNAFSLTPRKWVEHTNAIGIRSKAGRYGGTYAHKDIAFEFGAWLSPEFKLYLIKEFQRLKEAEYSSQAIEWRANRELAKINYRLQTEAIQQNLLLNIEKAEYSKVYASEADMLNVIVFGKTAKDHKQLSIQGNLRDGASALQNAIIANLEFLNSNLIKQGISQEDRYKILKEQAEQMKCTLENSPTIKKLSE